MVIFSGKDLGRRERNGRISGHHDACVTSILCLQYDGRFVMLTNSTDHIDMDVFRPHGEWDVDRTQSLGLAPAPSASHQLPRPHTSFLGLAPGTLASNQVPRPETQSLGLTLATLGLGPCPSASPNSTTATLESLPLQVWILNADFTRYSTL